MPKPNTYVVTILSDGDTLNEPLMITAYSLSGAMENAIAIHRALIDAGDEVDIVIEKDPS
jgi:hypothetical protein